MVPSVFVIQIMFALKPWEKNQAIVQICQRHTGNKYKLQFLLQSSVKRKPRYANQPDICLSFFFWFISTYITPRNTVVPTCLTWKAGDCWRRIICRVTLMVINCENVKTFTSVYVGVLFHIRFLMKSLATVLAGVRPGVGVDKQVCRERGWTLEGFAAHLALETFFLIKDKDKKKWGTIIS